MAPTTGGEIREKPRPSNAECKPRSYIPQLKRCLFGEQPVEIKKVWNLPLSPRCRFEGGLDELGKHGLQLSEVLDPSLAFQRLFFG
jgi:hypothetical protein